ncbi:MAG: hypothetical protein JWN87_97, partial [Frankiales bacterium]|nr:hypothetical protein [Frankiales bacterium]
MAQPLVGLAPVRRAQDLNASIARADAALYVAKAAGRNQVVLDAAGQYVPEQRMPYDRGARNSLRERTGPAATALLP